MKFSRMDWFVLAGLTLFSSFFALQFVNFSLPPIEDAAMLMRYADHFAHGYGIVWNVGEAPVDGATDFLFMVVLGIFVKAGLPLEFATRLLGFSAHIFTIWLIYLSLKRIYQAPVLIAIFSALYLAVGPGFFYVAGYFGTTFFALFASLAWYFGLTLIFRGVNNRDAILFALMALITSLIRPEGVILTGLMLLMLIWVLGWKAARQPVLAYLAFFIVLGGLYFFWRWTYFGYPLPNPFYKKGGGRIYLFSFQLSLLSTCLLTLPYLPAFISGIFSQKVRRFALGVLIPLLGFASVFIFLSHEMNFGARFQYVLLPLALMVWWPLTDGIREHFKISEWNFLSEQQKIKASLLIVLVGLGAMAYLHSLTFMIEYWRDGKYDVACLLADYQARDLKIATSEAGLLPLYSHWKALDLWGLNDQWIAHNGKLTEDYLRKFNPDLIMFHVVYPSQVTDPLAYFPIVPAPPQMESRWLGSWTAFSTKDQEWYEMAMIAKNYAEKNGYLLAGAFGVKPNDIDYYYVRSGLPETSEIIQKIRALDYSWTGSGQRANNYALP